MKTEISLELTARVDAFSKAWPMHDAKSIASEFFSLESWVVGEGMPSTARDEISILTAIEQMFSIAPLIRIEVVKTREYPNALSSWLNWHIVDSDGNIASTMRSLTVWEKIGDRLVIVADSYSAGAL